MESVARVMDDAVRIPVLGLRVGLDPLLGLIPGGGDLAAASVSGWIIVSAARVGASPSTLARMLLNLALDVVLGGIPVLGDLFDIGFKANRRNLGILEEQLKDPERARRRSRAVVIGAVVAVAGLLVGLAAFLVWLAAATWGILAG
jgi:hypothetical protein